MINANDNEKTTIIKKPTLKELIASATAKNRERLAVAAAARRKIVPVFFPTDSNYIPIVHVAVQSIVANSSSKYIYHIHVLGESLTEEDKNSFGSYVQENIKIFITDMTDILIKHTEGMSTKYFYSKSIYSRVFIPILFPEYKKAVYLDSDIALNADIAELFNYTLGPNYVAAITCDTVNPTPVFNYYAKKFVGLTCPKYFNSGVMVLNCSLLRRIKFMERFCDLMSKVHLEVCPDQDAYNILCRNRTRFLPQIWNKQPRPGSTEKLEECKLIHYNLSLKPWRYDDILYGELFWHHAKNTPPFIYEKLLEMKRKVPKDIVARDNARMEGLANLAIELSKEPESIVAKIKNGKLQIKGVSQEITESKWEQYRQKVENILKIAEEQAAANYSYNYKSATSLD